MNLLIMTFIYTAIDQNVPQKTTKPPLCSDQDVKVYVYIVVGFVTQDPSEWTFFNQSNRTHIPATSTARAQGRTQKSKQFIHVSRRYF